MDPPRVDLARGPAAAWAALRADRLAPGDPRVAGEAGPWPFARVSVSRVDRYLKCPFQFFASEVLGLEEEPEDEEAPPPWERGGCRHALLEAFLREWQGRGHGGIGAEGGADARALLLDLAEQALARLPAGEAALERTRLLGSAAGAGIIDRVSPWRPSARRRSSAASSRAGRRLPLPPRRRIDRRRAAQGQGGPDRPARRRHVPRHRLQVARRPRVQAERAAADLHLRGHAAAGPRPPSARLPAEAAYLSMEGDRPVKRSARPRRVAGRFAGGGRGSDARRDRRRQGRPLPAPAVAAVGLRPVSLRPGVPQGVRRGRR